MPKAVAAVRGVKRTQQLRAELARVEVRDLLARDICDRAIQRMFAVGLTLEGMLSLVSDPRLVQRLNRSISELDLTIREVRAVINDGSSLSWRVTTG